MRGLRLQPTYDELLASLDAPDVIKKPNRLPQPYLDAILPQVEGGEEMFAGLHRQSQQQGKAQEAVAQRQQASNESSELTKADLQTLYPQPQKAMAVQPQRGLDASPQERAEMYDLRVRMSALEQLGQKYKQQQQTAEFTRRSLEAQAEREKQSVQFYDIFDQDDTFEDPEEPEINLHVPAVPKRTNDRPSLTLSDLGEALWFSGQTAKFAGQGAMVAGNLALSAGPPLYKGLSSTMESVQFVGDSIGLLLLGMSKMMLGGSMFAGGAIGTVRTNLVGAALNSRKKGDGDGVMRRVQSAFPGIESFQRALVF